MSDGFYDRLFGVRGKVALVTGGTRGIGLMIAEGLVRAGARVYVSSRKLDACAETERTLGELGECIAIPGDLRDVAGCEALAEEFGEREDKLAILVNNVNAIAPGPFKSKMTAPLFATEEQDRRITESFPMKRWGRMEDAAGLTIFLSSRAGSYLTGQTIPCDGGATTIG